MTDNHVILYATEDGSTRVELRAIDGTVWLTQAQMAQLFDATPQNITLHLKSLYEDEELQEAATCKDFLQVRNEGGRSVERRLKHYNLDAILAVGYRVRSARGAQFRRWASTVLKDYLVKGFAMDDERLKDPKFDHFDELLERIRDIRASEARFYQKVRDILSLSIDYVPGTDRVQTFYATIQNKMLHAVTHHTAAELIVSRANPDVENMGLTTWKSGRVRKGDVTTAKNYLAEPEIKELNLIVTMFLDTAELRTSRRQDILLGDWEGILDDFLTFNELPILRGAGRVSATRAEQVAHERYESFDTKRREAERIGRADSDDLTELKGIADAASKAKKQKSVKAKKGDRS